MDFFQQYFIDPIIYDTGYNIVNTLVYALILIISAFLVYRVLKKLRINIDKNFFFALMPFIALGGILRSLEDLFEHSGFWQPGPFIITGITGILRNTLLITPLIYFFIFAIAFSVLLVSVFAQKMWKIEYYKIWFSSGMALCIICILQMQIQSVFALWLISAITIFWVSIFLGMKIFVKKLQKFLTNENLLIICVHMFDATTTFVALQFFPYWEQHVLPGFLIGIFGPVAMFFIKLPVVVAVLYFVDKEVPEIEKRTFLKIVVLMLGLGPGLRNFLRLVMGV